MLLYSGFVNMFFFKNLTQYYIFYSLYSNYLIINLIRIVKSSQFFKTKAKKYHIKICRYLSKLDKRYLKLNRNLFLAKYTKFQ